MRDAGIFTNREFQYGGKTYCIVNYSWPQKNYYARCLDRHYSADVFDAFFVEDAVSCPLEVALLLGR